MSNIIVGESLNNFLWLNFVRKGDKVFRKSGKEVCSNYVTFDFGIAYEKNDTEIEIVKMNSITEDITTYTIEKDLLKEVSSLLD